MRRLTFELDMMRWNVGELAGNLCHLCGPSYIGYIWLFLDVTLSIKTRKLY